MRVVSGADALPAPTDGHTRCEVCASRVRPALARQLQRKRERDAIRAQAWRARRVDPPLPLVRPGGLCSPSWSSSPTSAPSARATPLASPCASPPTSSPALGVTVSLAQSTSPVSSSYRAFTVDQVRSFVPDWAEAGFEFHFDHCHQAGKCSSPGGCIVGLEDGDHLKRLLVCLRCQIIVCAGCASHHQQDHMTTFERECLDDPDTLALYHEVHAACTSWVSLALR